ncbi:hypothetical protein [Allosaccharopolyspora coralli]|uniref:hypothetical protein n=1 Tax=Allosaccharopolyspora coralli TaxID=2665642 RepID=UPI003898F298
MIDVDTLHDPVPTTRAKTRHCVWCGRRLAAAGQGRPRTYCAQSCRQRAYERRSAVQRGGLPDDAVVLSATELADLRDRLFQLRCAAEDVVTAAGDGADPDEMHRMATVVLGVADDLDRLR